MKNSWVYFLLHICNFDADRSTMLYTEHYLCFELKCVYQLRDKITSKVDFIWIEFTSLIKEKMQNKTHTA